VRLTARYSLALACLTSIKSSLAPSNLFSLHLTTSAVREARTRRHVYGTHGRALSYDFAVADENTSEKVVKILTDNRGKRLGDIAGFAVEPDES
jgi:hypothetical protein